MARRARRWTNPCRCMAARTVVCMTGDDERSDLIIPARTREMEAWLPAGFHDDLDSPLTRLVVQRLMDTGAPAPTWTTASPIKPTTRKGYEERLAVWFRWAGLTSDEILALSHDVRCRLVEEFLAEKAPTVAASSITNFRCAIDWWALEHNVDSPVTDVAKAITGHGKGRGKAEILTDDELTALIAGLKQCDVVTGKTNNVDVVEGWHLRTRAALLVTISCSLRIESELANFKDDHILCIDDDGIHMRLTETKTGVRDVVIRPRGDELCPVAAIEDFYKWLGEHTLERPDGLLLPMVNRKLSPTSPGVLYGGSNEKHWWGKLVVPYMERLGFDMANKTLHGLRSMAITEAVNSGWSHTELRDLGGWASLNVAAGYARNRGANIDLYGDV